jgi:hypothetical protein
MLWLQIQPGNYRRLVEERGWSHNAFERWHAAAMTTALLEPSPARCRAAAGASSQGFDADRVGG